jgi:hypothetical protein
VKPSSETPDCKAQGSIRSGLGQPGKGSTKVVVITL